MATSPMKDSPLGIAARYNDAEAEEHGLPELVEKIGLVFDEVMYLAEQRALRCLAIEDQSLDWILGNKPVMMPVRLSQSQLARLKLYQSAYLDGICIGWRAHAQKGR